MFEISQIIPLLETVPKYEKTDFAEKGERRSGGKDLERQPLTVWIQTCQRHENAQFWEISYLP
jgi:hypothetical protein